MTTNERMLSFHGSAAQIPWPDLRRISTVVVLGLLCAAAVLIVWRRLAGALVNPLGPAALLSAGAVSIAAAATIRLNHRLDRAVMIVTSLVTAVLIGGLCLPGTPLVAVIVVGLFFVAEEGWAWSYLRHRGNAQRPSEQIIQQLTRTLASDGTESLSGLLRTPIAAGQRTANVHVAFCPPLAATPELQVEQTAGPPARIKTAQLLPYGARLDLKLAAAAPQTATITLRFSARTSQHP
jgi:hypothetical protein